MPQLVRWSLAVGWVSLVVVPLLLATVVVFPVALISTLDLTTEAFGKWPGFGLGMFAFIAGYPVALLMHELGHVCAARMVGWPVRSVTVGPVMRFCENQRWLWEWTWRANWMSGWVHISAVKLDRWRTALFAAGGPLANLIGLGMVLPFVVPGWANLVRGLATVFAAHSLFLLATTLLPWRGKIETDGLVLMRLLISPTWRGPPNSKQ